MRNVLVFRFGRFANPDKQALPLVAAAGGRGAVSRKCLFQNLELRDGRDVDQAPGGKTPAFAAAADLKGEQARSSVLHAVVVRLGDSFRPAVPETDLTPLGDGRAEQLVDGLRFHPREATRSKVALNASLILFRFSDTGRSIFG